MASETVGDRSYQALHQPQLPWHVVSYLLLPFLLPQSQGTKFILYGDVDRCEQNKPSPFYVNHLSVDWSNRNMATDGGAEEP